MSTKHLNTTNESNNTNNTNMANMANMGNMAKRFKLENDLIINLNFIISKVQFYIHNKKMKIK